ncbi:hypothetical protein DFH28DRAFT_928490 [Melampsora americana]|nr:hypothetical protein DFH28DRAFT_928490 [Melampsora americana]
MPHVCVGGTGICKSNTAVFTFPVPLFRLCVWFKDTGLLKMLLRVKIKIFKRLLNREGPFHNSKKFHYRLMVSFTTEVKATQDKLKAVGIMVNKKNLEKGTSDTQGEKMEKKTRIRLRNRGEEKKGEEKVEDGNQMNKETAEGNNQVKGKEQEEEERDNVQERQEGEGEGEVKEEKGSENTTRKSQYIRKSGLLRGHSSGSVLFYVTKESVKRGSPRRGARKRRMYREGYLSQSGPEYRGDGGDATTQCVCLADTVWKGAKSNQ